jgi:hypothetical protein
MHTSRTTLKWMDRWLEPEWAPNELTIYTHHNGSVSPVGRDWHVRGDRYVMRAWFFKPNVYGFKAGMLLTHLKRDARAHSSLTSKSRPCRPVTTTSVPMPVSCSLAQPWDRPSARARGARCVLQACSALAVLAAREQASRSPSALHHFGGRCLDALHKRHRRFRPCDWLVRRAMPAVAGVHSSTS